MSDTPHAGHGSEIQWDGWVYPYRPAPTLSIDPSLVFHDALAETIDPIDHEVLRFALWNVNVEHGNTIVKISGSPIAAYSHDFNPVILDGYGDFVMFGPYLQYLSSAASSAVKWTLENRSENPGIGPGDIFLANDPWMAATHQPDVCVLAPVFVDDKLFAWVANSLHQWDLGGTAPGGFNPMAPDVFWEPPCIPPVKMVEAGTIKRDVEELYTRFSRMPQLVALDLRATLVGCRVAVERIQQLCARYGAGVVKASMRKLQDDSERAFVARLETIPDGTWTAEGWMESAGLEERGAYKNRITLTKAGDRLTFTNQGSNEQIGALNATFVAWRGAALANLMSQMLFDQMFVIEGALRHIDFEVVPGTINCATRPASVSAAPAGTLLTTIGLSGLVLSKMLASSSDPALRSEVQSCMGNLAFPINAFQGIDQRGNPYSSFLLDPIGAAIPAYSWRDGQDTGGFSWDLQSTMPNVEESELFYPVLYLWRRELPDSGGAGRYRGGNAGEFAITPHKTERLTMSTVGSQLAVPGPGLFGGLPTSTAKFVHVAGADACGRLRAGETTPTEPGDVGGESRLVAGKTYNNEIVHGDVWICSWGGGGGYGDPLLRDPAAVEADVAAGRTSAAWAREAYGVVPGDSAATARRRREMLRERLGRAPTAGIDPDAAAAGAPIHESLELRADGIYCRPSDTRLCGADENWKEAAHQRLRPITTANPVVRDPAHYLDSSVEIREYYCPASGLLLDAEIVVAGADPQWDLRPGQTSLLAR